jgi:hypothetical protein
MGTVSLEWDVDGALFKGNDEFLSTPTITDNFALHMTYQTGLGSHHIEVHVHTPNDFVSNRVPFTVTCGGPFKTVANVVTSVNPASTTACPADFSFRGEINSNAVTGDVVFRWERSDGTIGSLQIYTLTGNETVYKVGSPPPLYTSVTNDTWRLNTSGTYWAQLHVLAPNDIISNKASFTLTCPASAPPVSSSNTLDLSPGWNMISSPFSSVPLSSLQGNCLVTGGPWWWNGSSYQQAATIDPGKGYWVKVVSACTMQAAAASPAPVNLSLFDGWNMISSAESWQQLNTAGCNLVSGPWWYNGTAYQGLAPDTPMDGFKGYWVKVSGGCSLTSQTLHQSWVGSPLPSGTPAPAQGLFVGLLTLLGVQETIAAAQQQPAMPLTLREVRLFAANAIRIELQIKGQGIVSSEVHVYALSGQLLADTHGTASQLHFTILSPNGQPLANGVYLYLVTVHGANGETLSSEVKKFVILR